MFMGLALICVVLSFVALYVEKSVVRFFLPVFLALGFDGFLHVVDNLSVLCISYQSLTVKWRCHGAMLKAEPSSEWNAMKKTVCMRPFTAISRAVRHRFGNIGILYRVGQTCPPEGVLGALWEKLLLVVHIVQSYHLTLTANCGDYKSRVTRFLS